MLSASPWRAHGIPRCDPRYKNKVSVNSWYFQVWRIGSVLVHVSQLSSSRVRWIWRIGSVLVHVSQLSCFRVRWVWRIGSVLVHVSQFWGFRVRWVWRIGSVLVHVSQLWWSSTFWKDVCVRVSSELCFAFINSTLNPNTKSSQIGIWCSGTRKCSQRYEIDHFNLPIFS